MYCVHCGSKISEGSHFCAQCGMTVGNTDVKIKEYISAGVTKNRQLDAVADYLKKLIFDTRFIPCLWAVLSSLAIIMIPIALFVQKTYTSFSSVTHMSLMYWFKAEVENVEAVYTPWYVRIIIGGMLLVLMTAAFFCAMKQKYRAYAVLSFTTAILAFSFSILFGVWGVVFSYNCDVYPFFGTVVPPASCIFMGIYARKKTSKIGQIETAPLITRS